jgi:hypothetical protein
MKRHYTANEIPPGDMVRLLGHWHSTILKMHNFIAFIETIINTDSPQPLQRALNAKHDLMSSLQKM